jgi:hypothetical protein
VDYAIRTIQLQAIFWPDYNGVQELRPWGMSFPEILVKELFQVPYAILILVQCFKFEFKLVY